MVRRFALTIKIKVCVKLTHTFSFGFARKVPTVNNILYKYKVCITFYFSGKAGFYQLESTVLENSLNTFWSISTSSS